MKTVLFVSLLAFAISAFAANDDDIAAVYAAVPSAKTISKTAYGYRVETTDGNTVFVNKSPFGYTVAGGKNTTFINRTSYGFRVTSGGKSTVLTKTADGYRVSSRQ
jgi:hypothetical protein